MKWELFVLAFVDIAIIEILWRCHCWMLKAFSNDYTCTIYNSKWYHQVFVNTYKWFIPSAISSRFALFFANQNQISRLLRIISLFSLKVTYFFLFVSVSATLPPQRPWIPLTRPNRTRPTCKYYHIISFPKQILPIKTWMCMCSCLFKH